MFLQDVSTYLILPFSSKVVPQTNMNSQTTNHGSIFRFYSFVFYLKHTMRNPFIWQEKYIREHSIGEKRKEKKSSIPCWQGSVLSYDSSENTEEDAWLFLVRHTCRHFLLGSGPSHCSPDGHSCHGSSRQGWWPKPSASDCGRIFS